MTVRAVSYNPAFLTDDQLVDQFIVREHELARLMETVRENTDPVNQHVLVIAPPGAGKTTLLRRVAAEIRRDADLRERWLPVSFGEEEYLVSTAAQLWLEAVLHLADATGDERWRDVHEALLDEADEDRLAARALARLRDLTTERGVRILLVAENLHQLLGDLPADEGWSVRKVLQNESWVMLLGSALSRFPAIEDPKAPMYELFERIELDALDDTACDDLWESVTGARLGPSRIRPIRILTGGSVRLVRMMATFSRGRSFRELMDGLLEFLDDHTNYFKHNIEDLDATTERKAFIALADLWEPGTARDVARRARLEVNATSVYLGRLVDRGRVSVVGKQGRAKLYQVSERLYNIYHLMRRRGTPRARVQALVAFMVDFYDERGLRDLMSAMAVEASDLPADRRWEHFAALESLLAVKRDEVTYPDLLRTLRPALLVAEDATPAFRQMARDPETLRVLIDGEEREDWLPVEVDAVSGLEPEDLVEWEGFLEDLARDSAPLVSLVVQLRLSLLRGGEPPVLERAVGRLVESLAPHDGLGLLGALVFAASTSQWDTVLELLGSDLDEAVQGVSAVVLEVVFGLAVAESQHRVAVAAVERFPATHLRRPTAVAAGFTELRRAGLLGEFARPWLDELRASEIMDPVARLAGWVLRDVLGYAPDLGQVLAELDGVPELGSAPFSARFVRLALTDPAIEPHHYDRLVVWGGVEDAGLEGRVAVHHARGGRSTMAQHIAARLVQRDTDSQDARVAVARVGALVGKESAAATLVALDFDLSTAQRAAVQDAWIDVLAHGHFAAVVEAPADAVPEAVLAAAGLAAGESVETDPEEVVKVAKDVLERAQERRRLLLGDHA